MTADSCVQIQMSTSLFRRWPLVITFEGPDGAGKTTLASDLADWMRSNGIGVRNARCRPVTTERLRTEEYDHSNPHDAPARGVIESFVRVGAKYVFYLSRWVVEARPTRRPTVLIRERGWLDYRVDGRRYGLAPSTRRFVSALGRVFPRSDYSVVLVGNARVIHDRKPDLDPIEIQRVMKTWKRLAPRTARTMFVIDTTSHSSAESLERLLSWIVKSGQSPRTLLEAAS